MESKNIKQLSNKKKLDKYNVIDYICFVIYSGVETVMYKDICPYGLDGSTHLTCMGFFYG